MKFIATLFLIFFVSYLSVPVLVLMVEKTNDLAMNIDTDKDCCEDCDEKFEDKKESFKKYIPNSYHISFEKTLFVEKSKKNQQRNDCFLINHSLDILIPPPDYKI